MNYPVVIHKDDGSDYGVTVPDLPGCYSAGRTFDEALMEACEAIELHMEGLIDEGQPVPSPEPIERHQRKAEYRGGTWAVVNIDPSTLRKNSVRVNITVPRRVLDAMDAFAAAHRKTRSELLVEAVTTFMGRGDDQASARQKKPRTRK